MEEILQKLIEENQLKLQRYNKEFAELNHKISFCRKHKFEVEAEWLFQRRVVVKDIILDYNDMVKKLAEILNDWNS